MGRILPSGAVFGATPLHVGQTAGLARATQPGEVAGTLLQFVQLANAIGGSPTIGAMLNGLGSIGSSVAGMFADQPMAPDVVAAELERAGVTPEQAMAALSGGVQPTPQAKPIPVDRVRLMLTRPGATSEDVAAALAFEGFEPGAVNLAIKRAMPPAPEDPRHTAVLGTVENAIRAGVDAANVWQSLIGSGAPPVQADSLIAQAMEAIEAEKPAEAPNVVEEVEAALRQGVTEAEIAEALIRRKVGPDTPLESMDIIQLANQRAGVNDVIQRATERIQASQPPTPEPTRAANMEQALAMAAGARTAADRQRAMAAVIAHAKPRTLNEMMGGGHKLRAAQEAQRLFPPLVRAAGKTPEELQLERDRLASQDAARKARARQGDERLKVRREENERRRQVAEGKKALAADKAEAAKKKADRQIKLVELRIQKAQADADVAKSKAAATLEGKQLKAAVDLAKANHSANTRTIASQLTPLYKERAEALAVSQLPAIPAAPATMSLEAQEKHELKRLERKDQVASAKATLAALKPQIAALENDMDTEERKLKAATQAAKQ